MRLLTASVVLLAAQVGGPYFAAAQQTTDLSALYRILVALASELDAMERRVDELSSAPNITAAIGNRVPIELRSLPHIQDDLDQLGLGDLRTASDGRATLVISNLDYFLALAHDKYDGIRAYHKRTAHEVDTALDGLSQRRRPRLRRWSLRRRGCCPERFSRSTASVARLSVPDARNVTGIAALNRVLAVVVAQLPGNGSAGVADVTPVRHDLVQLGLEDDAKLTSDGHAYLVINNIDDFVMRVRGRYADIASTHRDMVRRVDLAFDSLLQRRRLRPIVSAVARAGGALVDIDNASEAFEIGNGRQEDGAGSWIDSASVLWETAHWGHRGKDIAIRGQIGVMPVAAVYTMGNGVAATRVVRRQPALFYEAHFGLNFVKAQVSEFGIFGGAGQTHLWSGSASGDGASEDVGVPERRAAYYRDIGFEYRMYGVDARIAHHDKSLLSPVVRLSGGVRWNERLARPHESGWRHLANRWFLRLGVDLRQIVDRRNPESEKQETFGLRLIGQREWGSDAPEFNVVMLEADISLSNWFPGMPGK